MRWRTRTVSSCTSTFKLSILLRNNKPPPLLVDQIQKNHGPTLSRSSCRLCKRSSPSSSLRRRAAQSPTPSLRRHSASSISRCTPPCHPTHVAKWSSTATTWHSSQHWPSLTWCPSSDQNRRRRHRRRLHALRLAPGPRRCRPGRRRRGPGPVPRQECGGRPCRG